MNWNEENHRFIDQMTKGFYLGNMKVHDEVKGRHLLNLCQTWLELSRTVEPKDSKEFDRYKAIESEIMGLVIYGRTEHWLGGMNYDTESIKGEFDLDIEAILARAKVIQCDRCLEVVSSREQLGAHVAQKHLDSLVFYFEL